MPKGLAAGFLGVALTLLLAGCGDGPDPVTRSTPTAQSTVTASRTNPPAIDPPTIPEGNFDAIYPPHGARVSQESTRSPNPDDPQGACVQVNFNDLPGSFTWFRMAFDDTEVTPRLTIRAATSANTEGVDAGTLCWAPEEGFSVGVHTVTVAVQNPDNPNEPTRQLMQWQFEVTE